MNAYIERLLEKALNGNENEAQTATMRLLARAKNGLYEMTRPFTREEAHDRRA